MPITRSELIARSLVHADKMTHGQVSLPALVDHNHFNQLSPEEKAAVIQHYALLTEGKGNEAAQGHLDTIMTGAKKGLLASIIPAIGSTALTVPSLLAIRAASGNKDATLDIIRRSLVPAGILAGAGAGIGIFSEYMERANSAANNKYISRMLENIHNETDEQEKQVKAMSLVATAPTLNRRLQASEGIGPNIRKYLLDEYMNPGVTPGMVDKIMGQDTYIREDGAKVKGRYNNWGYVRNVPTHKLIPEEHARGRTWEIKEVK